MSHFLTRCREHGTIVAQCKCPGPKPERLVDCPGAICHPAPTRVVRFTVAIEVDPAAAHVMHLQAVDIDGTEWDHLMRAVRTELTERTYDAVPVGLHPCVTVTGPHR
jgi:hypothetical protein